jgi:hypothetical protein
VASSRFVHGRLGRLDVWRPPVNGQVAQYGHSRLIRPNETLRATGPASRCFEGQWLLSQPGTELGHPAVRLEGVMALTACRECHRDVSTEAAACPHCGSRLPRQPGMILPSARSVKVMPGRGRDSIGAVSVILPLARAAREMLVSNATSVARERTYQVVAVDRHARSRPHAALPSMAPRQLNSDIRQSGGKDAFQ